MDRAKPSVPAPCSEPAPWQRDAPQFAIAVGVLARLLNFAWWDWSNAQLAKALADFRSLGIDDVLARY